MSEQIAASVSFIKSQTRLKPSTAIVLGSGLGDFADRLDKRVSILASSVPFYPGSTVEGHSGQIVFGRLRGVPLLVFKGRVHYYESGDIQSVLYPVWLAAALGIKSLIMTNAAGAVNERFSPGDLMLITD